MTYYAGQTVQGADRFDDLGASVSNAGDVNGDGIDDFIVGAPYAEDTNNFNFDGSAYVVFGTPGGPSTLNVAGLNGANGFRITAENATSPTPYGYANAENYQFGTFVAGLGDINGDGIDDIAIAGQTANYYSYGYYSRPNFIYVIFGQDTSVAGDFAAEFTVDDLNTAGNPAGFRVDGVTGILDDVEAGGDINGDGFNDILISQTPVPETAYGGGDPGTTDPVLGYAIFGENTIGQTGAFDVDNLNGANGFAVLGVRSSTGYYGGYYGEGPVGIYAVQNLGNGLTSLGDVNGDGFDDVGIRVSSVTSYYDPVQYTYDTVIDKEAFVLFGKNAPFVPVIDPGVPSPDVDQVLWNTVSGSTFYQGGFYGYGENESIAGIGDINGDGFDDVAVGNPNIGSFGGEPPLPGGPATGRVSVYFGGPVGVDNDLNRDTDSNGQSDGLNVNGTQNIASPNVADMVIYKSDGVYDGFGVEVAGAGDVNGDGVDDFLIAASRPYGSGDTDAVYLIFGQSAFDSTTPALIDLDGPLDGIGYKFTPTPGQTGFFDRGFGLAVSGAGDVNSDGFKDIIIGAKNQDVPAVGSDVGTAYVIFGGLPSLEVVDGSDGSDDNIINVANLDVDIATGILPIDVSIRNAGLFSNFLSEGDSGATIFSFDVQRTGNLSETVSFDFDVSGFGFNQADGADFVGGTLPSGTVTFGAGQDTATLDIEVQGDLDIESSEDFAVTISNATTTGPSPISIIADESFGRIFNDDFPVQFRVSNASTNEGNSAADDQILTFTVTRSGNTSVAASVDYSFTTNSADASDFEANQLVGSTLNFAANETSKTIDLRIDEDVDIESNERVFINLSNAQSTATTAILDSFGIGTILNDDFPPRIQVTSATGSFFSVFVNEGNSGFTPVEFKIQRLGDTSGATEVTFDLNPLPSQGDFFAADSNDVDGFLPSFGNVVRFEDGESEKTVTVNVNGDGIIEPRETFELRITQVESFNGTTYDIFNPSLSAVILNDDGRPPVIPPGVESDVYGDPHIVTLDGLGYDFQAVGEYVLLETQTGAVNPFQVQVRFEPLEGSDLVSVTTRMAVDIGGNTVEIDALGPDPLLIDGSPLSAAQLALGALDVSGDGTPDIFFDAALSEITIVLNGENEQLQVKNTDGVLNVCVFLADTPNGNAGNVHGLMGNANGDTTDDLMLRDGSATFTDPTFDELYVTYADSWRVQTIERHFTDPEDSGNFPAGFPAAKISIDDLPASVLAAAEAAVDAAGITDPIIRESAILDFALTGDDDFLEGALGLAADPTEEVVVTDAPEIPLSIGVSPVETTVNEADGNPNTVAFTFWRIGDSTGDVVIDYALGGDVDAADLVAGTALTGQVTIPDGLSSATLTVGVLNDALTETDEALTVSITGNDRGALVASASGTTIIETDDFAPEAENDFFGTDEDTRVSGNVLDANPVDADSDLNGDTLTVTGVTPSSGLDRLANGGLIILPSGAHLRMNPDGSFTYDPFGFTTGTSGANDTIFDQLGAGDIGTDTFTYTIDDGNGGTDTATVSITVTGVNDAPVAIIDEFNLDEDSSVSGNVLNGPIGPDFDPEGGSLTVTAINGVDLATADEDASTAGTQITVGLGGLLTILSNGDFTFDTNGAYEDLGEDPSTQLISRLQSVNYTIEDAAGLPDTEALRFQIAGVNDAPVAQDDTFSTDEDTATSGDLFADNSNGADTDPDAGDTFMVTKINGVDLGTADEDGSAPGAQVTLSSGALLTVNDDGTFDYDPNGNFEGLNDGDSASDSFTYTISDGDEPDTATATITIDGVTDDDPGPLEVLGTDGNDRLIGTSEDEVVRSLAGNLDIIDITSGGADTLVFRESSNGAREVDYVFGLDQTSGDSLDLGDAAITRELNAGSNTYLFYGDDNDIIVLIGVADYEELLAL